MSNGATLPVNKISNLIHLPLCTKVFMPDCHWIILSNKKKEKKNYKANISPTSRATTCLKQAKLHKKEILSDLCDYTNSCPLQDSMPTHPTIRKNSLISKAGQFLNNLSLNNNFDIFEVNILWWLHGEQLNFDLNWFLATETTTSTTTTTKTKSNQITFLSVPILLLLSIFELNCLLTDFFPIWSEAWKICRFETNETKIGLRLSFVSITDHLVTVVKPRLGPAFEKLGRAFLPGSALTGKAYNWLMLCSFH